MLSKRNYKERLRQMEQKTERFSIRKLTIGAASVLIGLSFLGFNAETTHAATPSDKVENNATEKNINEQSNLNIEVDTAKSAATKTSEASIVSSAAKADSEESSVSESSASKAASSASSEATSEKASLAGSSAAPVASSASQKASSAVKGDADASAATESINVADLVSEAGSLDSLRESKVATSTAPTEAQIKSALSSINDATSTFALTLRDKDGNEIPDNEVAEKVKEVVFTDPAAIPSGISMNKDNGAITIDQGTAPGYYAPGFTVTYSDDSSKDYPLGIIVDDAPQVKGIEVAQGAQSPIASDGLSNYSAAGEVGYPSKVSWSEAPDTSTLGTKDYQVKVEYLDGKTTTASVPVSVTGTTQDGDDSVYYGTMTRTTFHANPVNTHKTTGTSVTLTPSKFDTITVESDFNYKTGVYGKSVTYNLSSDGTTYVNAADSSDTFAADKISYTWQKDYTPSTNVDQFNGNTGDTLATDPFEKTTTGNLSGNSKYRVDTTVSGDAASKLLVSTAANTWHNQYINFYGATPITGLTAIHNDDSSIPAATSAVDTSELTSAHNAAVSSTEWATKPDVTKVGDTTGTVKINFNDGTYLDVDVPVKITDNNADTYVPSYPDSHGLNDKPQTIAPEVKDDQGNVVSVPTGTTYTFTNSDNVPTGVTIDSSTGTITIPAGTTPGAYTIPVTVTYPDGNTDAPTASVTVDGVPEVQPITVSDGKVPDASTGIKNYDSTGKPGYPSKVEWTTTPVIDPTKPGTTDYTVNVTYPDGTTTTATVPVTVTNDAQNYTPEGQGVTTKQGTVPEAAQGIKNPTDLPTGTTYTWADPDKIATDVTEPGSYDETITVTYPDKSTDNVSVKVTVPAPEGQDIKTPANNPATPDQNVQTVPEASTAIKNPDDMPSGTTYTWKTTPDITLENGVNSKVVPATVVVHYPDGKTSEVSVNINLFAVTRKITRHIGFTNPITGKEMSSVQTATIDRTSTVDWTTGETIWGDTWGTNTLQAQGAPSIPGYTCTNPDAAPQLTLNGDTPVDLYVTFNLVANNQTGKISYVDGQGNEIGSTPLTGKTGESVAINPVAPENWKIVPGQTIPTSVTATATGIPTVTVKVEHGTKDVTDDPSQKDNVSKTITRTIDYVDPTTGKTETYKTQSVTLHRSATEDLVTGEITYSDWNTSKFDAVSAPEIAGYTVANPDKAPAMDVTGDTKDSTVTFTYDANSHTQVINYVDPEGKTIKTYDVPGKTGETVDTNIESNVPEGWVITDPKVTTSVTFGPDDPSAITVNIKHGTKDVTDDASQKDNVSKTITRTIDYVDPATGKTETYKTQSVTLHRTATEDLVTKEVTYGAWNTEGAHFDAVSAPEIAGYTVTNPDDAPAMDVTGDTKDSTVTFTYDANSHTQVINYVDPEGKTIKTYDVSGKTGETVNTNIESNVPEGWVITDPKVTTSVTFGADEPSAITVNIKHGTKDVTDDPSQKDNVSKTVTRTIDLDIAGKTSEYTKQTVTLHRTATEDLVTKEVTYGAWNVDGAKFDKVEAPAEAGYTVSNPDAAPEVVITGDTESSTVTFVYGADEHSQVINYVDKDGNVIKHYDVTGKTGETVDTNIQSNVPEGWVITDKTIPAQITFGSNNPDPINVNIEHGTKDVTDDPSQADKVSKTITRTIDIDLAGKTSQYTKQTVTIYRTATEDLVTKEVTYGAWNTEGAKFDAVTAPEEAGYTVSNPDAAPEVAITGDTESSTVVFNYTANEHTRKINFVDPDGKIVGTQTLTGKTGTSVTIGNGNGETPLNIPTGYEVVPNTEIPTKVPFNATDNPDITVKVQAKIDTDDGRSDKSNSDVYRQVTRTITVNIEGQEPQTVTQTLDFYRTKSTNEATGEVTYTDWASNMTDGSTSFPEVGIPSAAGYTRTITGGTITTKDGQDYVASVSGLEDGTPVNNIVVTVNYTKAEQTATIKYINNADHNNVVGTQEVPGEIGETVPVTLQVPANWQVVGGQNIPSSFTFGSTPIKDTIVYVEHKTEDVTNDPSQADNVNKTVTRTIDLDVAGKTSEYKKQTITIHRTATEDLVTNEVTYGAWNVDGAKFDAITAPAVAGYTVTNPDAAPEVAVTGDTGDSTVIFNYTADGQTRKINFVDPDGKTVGTQTLTGKTGTSVTIGNGNGETPLNIPTGYELVPNTEIPTKVPFNATDNPDITVKVQAKIDTDDGRSDKSNSDVYRQVTRTITVNIEGQEPQTVTQTLAFYRTKSTNEATGEVSYTDWTSNMTDGSTSFPEVEIPSAAGYTRTITGGTITTKDGKDYVAAQSGLEDGTPVSNLVVTVNYTKAAQTATIKFVNNTDHNDVVGTQEVPGEIGETVSVTLQVPANWQVVGGQQIPSEFTFGSTPIKDTIVYVEHKTEDVTNDPSQADKVNKTITRTIDKNVAGNITKVVSQSVTLHRSATEDLVTGEITYGAWNTSKFDAVAAPEVAGYTVTNPNAAPAMDVTDKTEDSTVTFNYVAGDHSVVINYVDKDGKTVKTYTVTGKTGEKVDTNIQSNVPAGYHITDKTVTSSITFGSDNPASITVNVAKDQTPAQPTDADKYTPVPKDINTTVGKEPNPEDGIGNIPNLPTGTKYTWTKGAPDVSTPGTKSVQITVTYPDGSTDVVTTKVIVDDNTPSTPVVTPSDNDIYTPEGQDIKTPEGVVPDASQGIKNPGNLPSGTTYTWQDPGKVTGDVKTPGAHPEVIVVTYPDGTTDTITVNVIVPSPEPQDIHTPQGVVPSPSQGIKNPDEMPSGTKYEWTNGTPDVSKPGTHAVSITVIYPDGTTDTITTTLTVTPHATEKNDATNKGAGVHGTDFDEEVGVHSGDFSESAGVHSSGLDDNFGYGRVHSGFYNDVNGNNNGKNAKTLPQTGAEANKAGLFGLAIASVAAILGLAAGKKRKN